MKYQFIILVTSLCLICFSQIVQAQHLHVDVQDKGIAVMSGERLLLFYQTQKAFVPDGVDNAFSKSGFIHPLNTLSGETLTRIHPEDHYHHYGIWGPWTKTSIAGRSVDFWNLGDQKGRVEFDSILSVQENGDWVEINVRQKHQEMMSSGTYRVAMWEELLIRVKSPESKKYQVEYISKLSPQNQNIVLEAYRYGGGIGFRARADWGADNSTIITSKDLLRNEVDGKDAEWVLIKGSINSSEVKAGLLLMSHPGNWTHPEPLRVWPEDAEGGKGNVFLNFTPTRNEAKTLEVGKTYTLRYGIVVFDEDLSVEESKHHFNNFKNSEAK